MFSKFTFLLLVSIGSSFYGNSQDTIVYPPLVFSDFISPNNDGNNDFFIIQNIGEYENNSLEIFNRWGEKVFEAKPYINDWAGTSTKGMLKDELPDGTYFFVLNDGVNNTYNGRITIKRK